MVSFTELETQALGCIADGLAGADPRLASMLAIFSRLAAGEERGVGAQHGDESPEEDHLHAVPGEQVAPRLEPGAVQADVMSVALGQTPAASRLKMASMDASRGSEPARPSAMAPRACASGSVRLIIITSDAGA